MKKLIIFTIFILILALLFCGKRYRLTKKDTDFNPYKVGDSLLFHSDKDKKDTLIIASIERRKLNYNSYFFFDYEYLFGDTWETYEVSTKFSNNRGAPSSNILTIRAEPNGTKTISFDFTLNHAFWYGNEYLEKDANNILNLQITKFERGLLKFNDVIVVPSSDEEYKERDDYIYKIYWSKSNGFVGFDMLNGEEWAITKK